MTKSHFVKGLIVVILIVCSSVLSFAASDEQSKPADLSPPGNPTQDHPLESFSGEFDRDYVMGYFPDAKTIVTAPARWEAADWLTAVGVAGVTAGLYTQDGKIQNWAQKNKTSTADRIGDGATSIGFGAYTLPLLGGLYLYGHLADDAKARTTVLLAAESFVLTGVITQTIKFSAHRHRPYSGDPYHTWDGPGLSNASEKMSFPSGHASSAFAIATVVASEYENSFVVPPLAYGIASLTAMNRVLHNAHWTSDIFFGSAVGYFTGKMVVKSHDSSKKTNLMIVPVMDGKQAGLLMTYNY